MSASKVEVYRTCNGLKCMNTVFPPFCGLFEFSQILSKLSKYTSCSFTGAVTNIPQGMVTDQFGMVGLLTFIRAAETDPNLVALAPGIDLTTLGLNLNSPE